MKKTFFFYLLFLILLIIVFRSVFSLSPISGGDYITFWPQQVAIIKNNAFSSWVSTTDLGSSSIDVLHGSPFNYLMGITGALLGNNVLITERLFWWLPFFVLSFFSSVYLFKKLFPSNKFFLFSPFIFLFNTYVLMMIGGGQIAGVGLAYSVAPLVLAVFIGLINAIQLASSDTLKIKSSELISKSLIAGLLLSLQVVFDYRIAYITVIAILLYCIVELRYIISKKSTVRILSLILYTFIIPFGITFLLHAFWIVPAWLVKSDVISQLGPAFTSLQSVSFFSFAKFENTISLLHPNWPENIFGKVYFMRPEFLIIPIIAYASLFFIKPLRVNESTGSQASNKRNILINNPLIEKKVIIFFVLLGLLGAFLAKGANDPFGGVYLWMFQHVPGFIMFRDPTKWYTLVAISYSVLIPFTIWETYGLLKQLKKFSIFNFRFSITSKNNTFNIQNFFLVVFIIFWLFTIHQAVFGQLSETFKSTTIPEEYVSFSNYLSNQSQFSRTLWIPTTQRFGFSSQNHPAILAEDIFNIYDEKGLIKKLNQPGTKKFLQSAGVKYVVVPSDSQKEIFLSNRLYSEKLYKQTVNDVSKIYWLKPLHQFGNLIVFQVPNPKDHFWSPDSTMKIHYSLVNQTEYKVTFVNAKKNDILVFSDSYDNNWFASWGNGLNERSLLYNKKFNSFLLPKSGNYTLEIYYAPQKLVNMGMWISLGTLAIVLIGLVVLKRKL